MNACMHAYGSAFNRYNMDHILLEARDGEDMLQVPPYLRPNHHIIGAGEKLVE